MSLIYTLDEPISVGDLSHQIKVSSLVLSSIAINYEPVYREAGIAVLSICLHDPVTNYPVNVVYQDASALTLAETIEAQVGAMFFQKLTADGKLPSGKISLNLPVVPTPA